MHNSAYMNMTHLVDTFKALSDESRMRILNILIKAGSELCVCEIADSLIESHYNISRHLKELRNAGLISERKQGRWVHYQVDPSGELFKRLLLNTLSSMPRELFKEDEKRLKLRMSLRKGGACVIGPSEKLREKLLALTERKYGVQKAH